jgi:hypothetical protein
VAAANRADRNRSPAIVLSHPLIVHMPIVQLLQTSTLWASPMTVPFTLDPVAVVVGRYLLAHASGRLDATIATLSEPDARVVRADEADELQRTLNDVLGDAPKRLYTLRSRRMFVELLHERCLMLFAMHEQVEAARRNGAFTPLSYNWQARSVCFLLVRWGGGGNVLAVVLHG